MKILFLSILLLFTPYKDKYSCLELDIVVLVDISGSLQGYELYVHNALNSLIDGLKTSEDGIRMGIAVFGSRGEILSSLSGDKEIIKSQISHIFATGGSTNMTDGLYVTLNEFINNGRQGVKKLIVVISDGDVDSVQGTTLAAQQLKLANISICSVLIVAKRINAQLMKDISNGCYLESDYENLPKEIEKLDICI